MKKYIVYAASVAMLFTACGQGQQNATSSTENNSEAAEDQAPPKPVVPGTAAVKFNGTLETPPQSKASVSLSIDGIVASTNLISGQYVTKGDLLATIENPEFISLQQEYLEASAQAAYLKTDYERQVSLSHDKINTQKVLEQSKADYLSMKSRKEAAAARLTILGVDPAKLSKTGIQPLLEVRAPISGYVSSVKLNLGKFIPAGEPLCEIVNKSDVLLKLAVYEKDIEKIKEGDKLSFRVNGINDEAFGATVVSVGQQVDGRSRSLEVYAKVDTADSRLRPGMYVNATVARN